MECLECGGKSAVMETRRLADNTIYRRRKCRKCGYIFHTLEEAIDYEDIALDIADFYQEYRKRSKE